MRDLICALLAQDKRTGEIVTCGMKFSAMCNLAKSLFVHKVDDEELREFFSELMPQVEHCGEGRNAYVHSSWYTQEPIIPYIRSKPKIGKDGHFRDNWQAMGCGEINDLADLIDETAIGVFELLMHMQHKGMINFLALGTTLPEELPRHFKTREKPTKPWTATK
ncbi:MAG: hypothetical protein KAU06_04085 [Candidatus Marinimicrobia bacterium]|nr:hypothetical protein [Candidatus Neomarinimicrobiota bacterium]